MFYKEALQGVTQIEVKKGIQNIEKWDEEHIFYNPLFRTRDGKTLPITKTHEKKNIYTLDRLLEEKAKETRKQPFDKEVTKLLDKIILDSSVRKEDIFIPGEGKEIRMSQVTQKLLYEETLMKTYKDHHSQGKWFFKLKSYTRWDEVWKAVHNILSTNKTKSIIWQQIHLNFYTQYSYNKWYNVNDHCPLCQRAPESIFHIILHCDFTNKLWGDIEPTLIRFHPIPISDEEKAFGISQKEQTVGILIRNWVTYIIRQSIEQEERETYHSNRPSIEKAKKKINETIEDEIKEKLIRYKHENKLDFIEKYITFAEVLCIKQNNGEYQIKKLYK